MKKIIMLFLLVFIVACSSSDKGTVECTIEYTENHRIERSLLLKYVDNEVVGISSADKIYFDESFNSEVLEVLEKDLADKLSGAKYLTYTFEKFDDHVLVNANLSSIIDAYDNELSFLGLSINDKELPLGLAETIKFNEELGYTCSVQ